jgi:uncharacterized membrane protein
MEGTGSTGEQVEAQAGAPRSRVVELIVLIESVALAVWSLAWLGVATVQSHMGEVRWEMWGPTRGGDVVYDNYLPTSVAVLVACFAMVLIVALAAFGFLTAHRFNRGQIGIAVSTRFAALMMLPLTITLPCRFAAFQQTHAWAGDGHGLELMVKYGAFGGFLLGIALLMGTRAFVDAW